MITYLFSYGRLQSPYSPPKTAVRFTKAYVHGRMWSLGNDPAITDVGDRDAPLIEGQRIEIDSEELPDLDRDEGTDHMRFKTNVIVGHIKMPAWIYVYRGKIPAHAKLLKKWAMKDPIYV